MISTNAVLATVFFASAAVAAPSGRKGTGIAGRLARREAEAAAYGRHKSVPNMPGSPVANTTEGTYVEYSTNWAGAAYSDLTGVTSVTGTFTVPTPSVPSGGSSSTTYSASAWVGIDGFTCDTAILQTGVDFSVRGSSVSYDAWYEWYPDYAYDFSGITFSAGDTVTTTVTATSKTSGTAVIENVTKGKTVTKSISSSSSLCETNAEWIVEDYESNGSLVPLADWGTVTFTDAVATYSGGTTGPEDATIIDIEQSNKVLTSVSVTDTTVTVEYV